MGPSPNRPAPLPALLFKGDEAGRVTGASTGDAAPVAAGSWQNGASSLPFDQSSFNQMVAQLVNEPAALPAAVPTTPPKSLVRVPAVAVEPLPDNTGGIPATPIARTTTSEALPSLPTGTRRMDTTAAVPKNSAAQPPSMPIDITLPVPVPPGVQLPPLKAGGSDEKTVHATTPSVAEETPPPILTPKPLLEVRINLNPETAQPDLSKAASSVSAISPEGRSPESASGQKKHGAGAESDSQQSADDSTPNAEVDGRPTAPSASHPAAPVVSATVVGAAAPLSNHAAAIISNPAATVPVVQSQAQPIALNTPTPARQATASEQTATALREELPIDLHKPQTTMRSLSLEFTPDGSHDIKLRLSERGGDVHISVHGTDASLAGRLREGVGDLVGTLSKAGYDAEAWTPDHGRQNQRPPQEQRKARRDDSGGTTAEEFSGILQQPIQEIS